jgi:hypothetical protein
MKVVELFIDDEEDLAGGEAIAMVKSPAHMSDFVAFNEEKNLNEVTEIIPTEEEQEKLLQEFSQVGVEQQQFMMKGHSIVEVEIVEGFTFDFMKEKFASTDINARPITDVLKDKSVMDYEENGETYKVRFRYATRPGRPSILSTSRKFCKDMISANKTYRLEDINKIMNGFQQYGKTGDNWGNAMFRFGGPNCGHVFVKVTYKELFKKKLPTGKYETIEEQSRDEAAIIAGSNMNQKTQDNPSANTIKRAGLGQFSSQDIQKFNEELAKKYQLAGAVLIPDKLIYRRDATTNEEYYCYFSKESVKKIAFKYMRDKNTNSSNLEHNQNKPVENVTLVESWIIDEPNHDKSNQYGFNLPEGSWFGIIDCSKNQKFWSQYVENGKVQGFSLEGYFESKLVKFYQTEKHNSNIDIDTYILAEIENLLNKE